MKSLIRRHVSKCSGHECRKTFQQTDIASYDEFFTIFYDRGYQTKEKYFKLMSFTNFRIPFIIKVEKLTKFIFYSFSKMRLT